MDKTVLDFRLKWTKYNFQHRDKRDSISSRLDPFDIPSLQLGFYVFLLGSVAAVVAFIVEAIGTKIIKKKK